MTDKERLKDVKELINKYENCHDKDTALKYADDLMRNHARYFIEQAERVQELEKYYISEKRLKELLNGNEDIGELYQFVEDNQKIEDVISMIIKEMGYLAGALDDYNKGFFELEKQNKRYREALENTQNAILQNLQKWNYKDEVKLYEAYKHNEKALEG